MVTTPESSEAYGRLEKVVIPIVETSVRERKPLFFGNEQVVLMRDAFAEAGVNYNLEKRERESLLSAPHLRLRAKVSSSGLVTGVEVYDRTVEGGKTKWRDFDPTEKFGEEPFLDDDNENFADKSFGLIAALGGVKTARLVEATYETAVKTKIGGKIGGHDGTQGRGGLQQAATILGLTFIDEGSGVDYESALSEVQIGMNQRLEKSLLKANFSTTYKRLLGIWSKSDDPTEDEWTEIGSDVRIMNQAFRSQNIPNPSKTTPIYSPEGLTNLIRFLAKK